MPNFTALRTRFATSSSERAPKASAIRFSVPNWFVSTGYAEPSTFPKEECRAARLDDAVGNLRDLEIGLHSDAYVGEFARAPECSDELR
jgi:hypothetical protein